MRRFLVAAVLSFAALAAANAQDLRFNFVTPSSGDGGPVKITGFRYERPADNVHVYNCEIDRCVRGSKIIVRFLAPSDKLMTLDEFRAGQEAAAKALAPRVVKVEILSAESLGGPQPPAHVKLVTRHTDGGGVVEYGASGLIMGQRAFASLISTSPVEAAAEGNYGLFATGLLILIAGPQPQQGGSAK